MISQTSDELHEDTIEQNLTQENLGRIEGGGAKKIASFALVAVGKNTSSAMESGPKKGNASAIRGYLPIIHF